ncbi:MAG TPA: sugar transferase [Saprospiraceae bacterium]|nr:sugar transferase [Saprospiraceae bacterium]
MKRIRQRDSLIYILASGLAFVFAFTAIHYPPPTIHHPPPTTHLLVFLLGSLDAFLLENAQDIYRLSRMRVAWRWFFRSAFYAGVWILMVDLKDSQVLDFGLWLNHWLALLFAVGLVKLALLTWSSHRLKNKKVSYRSLLIGSGPGALGIWTRLSAPGPSMGQQFIGYIGNPSPDLPIPHLGHLHRIDEVISKEDIEEVVIAPESNQYGILEDILRQLRSSPRNLMIRLTPESYDFLMGRVRLDAVYGTPLIELPAGKLPLWQEVLKRAGDILLSSILLILLIPLILLILIRVRLDSPGPLLYSQLRIGRYGRPFRIYKFRSMYSGAEKDGPQLSHDGDSRCTPWGAFMRKWRLDEIPQFINVLRGEMSIVGPRPERQYYIDQIMREAPYYSRILTVRPGITSWGQVKYGYASDLSQMLERLRFDLIYVENLSLQLDIKIILYTILVLFQGKGK